LCLALLSLHGTPDRYTKIRHSQHLVVFTPRGSKMRPNCNLLVFSVSRLTPPERKYGLAQIRHNTNTYALQSLLFFLAQVINAADIDYLRSTITKHFSDNRNHVINNTNKLASMEFIYNEFKRFGLETSYHNFSSPSFSSVSICGSILSSSFRACSTLQLSVVSDINFEDFQNVMYPV
jgi:hypothetical protein